MNPIILPIVQTRKLRLEKFNNLPEVLELVSDRIRLTPMSVLPKSLGLNYHALLSL